MADPTQASVPLDPPESFLAASRDLGVEVSGDARRRLQTYLDHLLTTTRSMNLTAIRDPETAWLRHILDSLTLLPLLTPKARLIDVGSGGGLPGLVIALLEPNRPVTLLDSTAKKCRFLEDTAAALGCARVDVVCARAEEGGRNPNLREQFDIATARGLNHLSVAMELLSPFLRIGGTMLAMKGKKSKDECRDAAGACRELSMTLTDVVRPLPRHAPDAAIVVARKCGPTPDRYPRRTGIPAKRPL